jgi:hypothetical protein
LKKRLQFVNSVLGNINFWIILFFLFRLYNITAPPIDAAHSWRQVTGNMVARNFLEIDNNILLPRVDMAGEMSGITGTEFPILNYLIYLMALVFGWQEWYGRLIVLIVSSFGLRFFYKLIEKKHNSQHAFYATMLLISSLWFIYSRKIMPDTFSVSLVIMGLWYAWKFLENSSIYSLLFSVLFATAGILSKIPALIIFTPLALIYLDRNYKLSNKIYLVLAFLPSAVFVVWWYFVQVPFLVQEYGFWHYYMGVSMTQGAKELWIYASEASKIFYSDAMKYTGFALFLLSLIVLFRNYKKEKNAKTILQVFIVSSVIFAIFMLKSGRNFAVHSYYIVPFVPFMTYVSAWILTKIPKQKLAYFILAVVMIEGIINQIHDFRIKQNKTSMLRYEAVLDEFSYKEDLILINGGDNPTDLYFTHRKGWSMENNEIKNPEIIDSLHNLGCKFILINKHYESRPEFNQKPVYQEDEFEIYECVVNITNDNMDK